ncbi:Homeobox protein invected [Eumeta japonica]|uniref:Homeobox protein invected n=1 Tax=Eumeta variegata TaxID=151549 RepID=A0A4C1UUG4_EUMVA|nr:Homeobox protein invected [Eumeta japonica]
MAAVSSVVHTQSPERIKIQEQCEEEIFSPTRKEQDDDNAIKTEQNRMHISPFSIQNVLKKERDSSSPEANENVFSTEKLLQNTPNYETERKLDYPEPEASPGNDSPEPISPGLINSPESPDNAYSNPDSVRAEINVDDDISCCSGDTVLSVGNEAPVSSYNSPEESTSKSNSNSPGASAPGLTSFKHIQTHLNAISQLSQNLNIAQPLLLRPSPVTPNPLMFLNQSHLLFQNPLINHDGLKHVNQPRVTPSVPNSTSPTNLNFPLNQFGVRNLKGNSINQSTSFENYKNTRSFDENRRINFTTSKSSVDNDNDESRDLIINQNCLKFSIDNILKADFGRRITDPLNKRKIQKKIEVKSKEIANKDSESRLPEIAKVAEKNSAIDLSKNEEGASGNSNSNLGSEGPMVWPAWVYCTRYSDRPSSVQRIKLYCSELPANDAMRMFSAPRPFLLLPRFPISRHCDDFVTNFTAAELPTFYCTVLNK